MWDGVTYPIAKLQQMHWSLQMDKYFQYALL